MYINCSFYSLCPLLGSVQEASGPLLVEVGRRQGNDLGLSLGQRHKDGRSYIIIERINVASIAERFVFMYVSVNIAVLLLLAVIVPDQLPLEIILQSI